MTDSNVVNWKGFDEHIDEIDAEENILPEHWDVLDFGCHTGGHLKHLMNRYPARIRSLTGIEPLKAAREQAQALHPEGIFLDRLDSISDRSIDLIVCHEVFYLIEDLRPVLAAFERVLRMDGVSLIAMGCHAGNVIWDEQWREAFQAETGNACFVHEAMDIAGIAQKLGFFVEAGRLLREQPLTRRLNPKNAGWGFFTTLDDMDEYHRQKRMIRLFKS